MRPPCRESCGWGHPTAGRTSPFHIVMARCVPCKRVRQRPSFQPMKRSAVLLIVILLAACGGDNGPGPDPGPGRIIFTRVGNGLFDIYAMDLNGSNLEQLTTSFAFDDWGTWSPDTFKIAFQSNQRADTTIPVHYQIFVMNSDGSNRTQLTVDDGADNFHPALSPNGTNIAFSSTRDSNPEIYVMAPNGLNVVRLTHYTAHDAQP